MSQKIKARRRFITRDQGLTLSTEQLSVLRESAPLEGETIAGGSHASPAARTNSVSSDISNYYTTEEIPWTDSSETTRSGSTVSRLKDFFSPSGKQVPLQTVSDVSSVAPITTDSCFKPISASHRGSTASESASSIVGIFSSSGGTSTPVRTRRRQANNLHGTSAAAPSGDKQTAVSTNTTSHRLDVVGANHPSSAPASGRTDGDGPNSTRSVSIEFQIPLDPNDVTAVPMTSRDCSKSAELRQSVVVLQPRTVQLSSAATAMPLTANRCVSAPTGASKLVPSSTSAFSVAQGIAAENCPDADITSRQRVGRVGSRQQRQGPSSVRRMAMLFEEPSKQSNQQLPTAATSFVQRSGKGSGGVLSQSQGAVNQTTVVNSELFFFPASAPTRKPSKKKKVPTATLR